MNDFSQTNFGGADYTPERDQERMTKGMGKVFAVMVKTPHTWYTLQELAKLSGVPQSSVGSYLCYLRRDFAYEVPKQYVDNGLYKYKLGNKLSEQEQESIKRAKDPVIRVRVLQQENEIMRLALENIRNTKPFFLKQRPEAIIQIARQALEKIKGLQ